MYVYAAPKLPEHTVYIEQLAWAWGAALIAPTLFVYFATMAK